MVTSRPASTWMIVTLALAGLLALPACGGRRRVARPLPRHGLVQAGPLQQPDASQWITVRARSRGFAFRMPSRPSVTNEDGYASDGAHYEQSVARVTTTQGTFAALVVEWEGGVVGDPLEDTRRLADLVMDTSELVDRESTRLSVPGFYAREDLGLTEDGVYVALRQFVGRGRVYVVIAGVHHDARAISMARDFVQSVHLDQADALLPVGGDGTEAVPLYMPEVDFAITMPPLTMLRTDNLEISGTDVPVSVFDSRRGATFFRVRVLDFPNGIPARVLDSVATALTLGESRGFVTASGYPGRLFVGDRGQRSHAYATGARVYVLTALTIHAESVAVSDPFFRSFRIL